VQSDADIKPQTILNEKQACGSSLLAYMLGQGTYVVRVVIVFESILSHMKLQKAVSFSRTRAELLAVLGPSPCSPLLGMLPLFFRSVLSLLLLRLRGCLRLWPTLPLPLLLPLLLLLLRPLLRLLLRLLLLLLCLWAEGPISGGSEGPRIMRERSGERFRSRLQRRSRWWSELCCHPCSDTGAAGSCSASGSNR
jgi:hypothetical protein